jgi:hypothetical protein
MMVFVMAIAVALFMGMTPGSASAESKVRPRLSTDDVENQITLDRESNPLYESILLGPVSKWRDGVGWCASSASGTSSTGAGRTRGA